MPVYNRLYQATDQTGRSFAFPAGLRQVGPCVSVQVEIPAKLALQFQKSNTPIPPPVAGIALIDTGASVSAADGAVIQQLGLQPIGVANVGTAGGPQVQSLYPCRFTFPGSNLPGIEFSSLLGANLSAQSPQGLPGKLIALLGRDILERCVFIYNGPNGSFTLSY